VIALGQKDTFPAEEEEEEEEEEGEHQVDCK
jgi:hypothetical protein